MFVSTDSRLTAYRLTPHGLLPTFAAHHKKTDPLPTRLISMTTILRNAAGWMVVFFAISFAAILATATATPPASDTFSEPDDVTRQDGWPESKKRHMEEGDFWYWVESLYADGALPIPAGTDAALEEGGSTSPFELEALDEFHEFDLFLWCALLPLLTYGWLGLGVGTWRTPPFWLVHASLWTCGLSILYALSLDSWALYDLLWDVSIYWTNWLGWTYYDFNVRFFIFAPAIAISLGSGLMIARAGRHLRKRGAPGNAESGSSKTTGTSNRT